MATKTTPEPTETLAPSRGARVCRFIEEHCVHGEGDFFGEPFRLRRWQRKFLYRLYELNRDGTRRYRRALWGLPKGSGKTEMAAAIAMYELCGEEHVSPLIPVAAASFEQADLVFGVAKVMGKESPTLRHLVEVFDTEILLRDRPGRMYRWRRRPARTRGSGPLVSSPTNYTSGRATKSGFIYTRTLRSAGARLLRQQIVFERRPPLARPTCSRPRTHRAVRRSPARRGPPSASDEPEPPRRRRFSTLRAAVDAFLWPSPVWPEIRARLDAERAGR